MVYASIWTAFADPSDTVMHGRGSAGLDLPEQPQADKSYGQTVLISVLQCD